MNSIFLPIWEQLHHPNGLGLECSSEKMLVGFRRVGSLHRRAARFARLVLVACDGTLGILAVP